MYMYMYMYVLSGHLEKKESSIAVSYSSGHYSLHLLDHIKVRIHVESSRAHGFSLKMQLLACSSLTPQDTPTYPTQKREVGTYRVVQAVL